MSQENFEYSELFKEKLALKQDNPIKELWKEYQEVVEHNISELGLVLNHILKSPFGITVFKNKIEDILNIFNCVNDFSEHSLKVLNSISCIAEDKNPIILESIMDFVSKKYEPSYHLDRAMEFSGLKKGSTKNSLETLSLLMHIKEGMFLYHKNGWGVGEIKKVDLLKGEATIDFEGSDFPVDVSMNGIKNTLMKIDSGHFLVSRFSAPNEVEAKAKKDPESVIYHAIKDIGPISSQDITLLFKDVIINSVNWNTWWTKARAAIKNSSKISVGIDKKWRITDEEGKKACSKNCSKYSLSSLENDAINCVNNANLLHDEDFSPKVRSSFDSIREFTSLEDEMLAFMYASYMNIVSNEESIKIFVKDFDLFVKSFDSMAKSQFKKHLIGVLGSNNEGREILKSFFLKPSSKRYRADIKSIFIQNKIWTQFEEDTLKDVYSGKIEVNELRGWLLLKDLQTIKNSEDLMPALLYLIKFLQDLSKKQDEKAIIKKIVSVIKKNHYKILRDAFNANTLEHVKDFIVIADQCAELNDSDIKIIRNIANVSFPGQFSSNEVEAKEIVWTTRSGLKYAKDKVSHIISKEFVENAEDIKKARAYGDLRENSEYSSALEKRRELQSAANKILSKMKHAKCIEDEEVDTSKISVGCSVTLSQESNAQKTLVYNILGPWDVEINKKVISYATGVAKSLLGKKVGEQVVVNGKKYNVESIGVSTLLGQVAKE